MHEDWLRTKVLSGDAVQYIIALRESGRRIGSVYLRDIDRVNRSAEFGIYIGEDDARGRGYGREAAEALVRFGFAQLGLHRVFLRAFAYNENALRCYDRAGFSREGVFRDMVRIDGAYYDMVFMACLNV